MDTEGNQLPYIDRLDAVFFSDRQVAILNMMQGNIDIGGRLLHSEEFPLHKENAAKGEEPPEDEKKFINLYLSYVNAVNPAEDTRLAKEFWAMATKRLELIGTVGKVARPINQQPRAEPAGEAAFRL